MVIIIDVDAVPSDSLSEISGPDATTIAFY
jgi:hypothetical protein